MDIINITANDQQISFSSKSLTIDGVEFKYKGITAIKHSSAKHVYLFKYENEWHNLYYNPDDAKKVAIIFSRVAALNANRSAKASQEAAPAAAVTPDADAEITESAEAVNEGVTEAVPAVAEETPKKNAEATGEVEASDSSEDTAKPAESEDSQEDENSCDDEENESREYDPERKSKLKKSILILAIIIAVFVVAGIVYFFTLGPSNDASISPNTDSTHQYDDIDELIDEMQE